MKRTSISAIRPWQLQQAVRTIWSGGIIAYPTEAVYGLGCNPDNLETVKQLLILKQRTWNKGLILIASNLEQLTPYIQPLSPALLKKINPTWPGSVTWIVPALPDIPPYLARKDNTIAVRVTGHPIAAALCNALDHALISTSANISKHPPARMPFQVRRIFHNEIDKIIHGATGGKNNPSEIRDAKTGNIIRSN